MPGISILTITIIFGKQFLNYTWHNLNLAINLRRKLIRRGQTADARRTTILQTVERKPHSQKDRQNKKAAGYVPNEGTR